MYRGPAGAGKSGNLAWHREAKAAHRGELLTTSVGRDRTLCFDFEPLHPTRDFTIRFLVATLTGRSVSGATFKQVMRGPTASCSSPIPATDRLYDTLTSYRETAKSLDSSQLEAGAVPVVLQYNKRDVEHALSRAELDEGVNPRKQETFAAVVTLGEGVLETLHAVLRRTLASIAPQNESLPLLRGMTIEAWTEAQIRHLYGRGAFTAVSTAQAREDSRPVPVLAMPIAGASVDDVATEPITRMACCRSISRRMQTRRGRG